jgi:hypothetical protein
MSDGLRDELAEIISNQWGCWSCAGVRPHCQECLENVAPLLAIIDREVRAGKVRELLNLSLSLTIQSPYGHEVTASMAQLQVEGQVQTRIEFLRKSK